ncbi:MAG: hypothetical protein A2Y25_03445 [Candidatus Melainabacteria bacterium GWF2_37_15]|nr:MAG: hypothetical protein A2Y25_03445 [Candidatus Melainabacteria bacterium GWF2_37_15]
MVLDMNCDHSSAKAKNCNYCPDCGKKIVHKWVTIKCRECGHYRKPTLDIFGRIKPVKRFCFNCGSDKWNYQYYMESTIPDKMKVISIQKIQTEEEHNSRFKNINRQTKVWVSRA